jgi:uncharacterized protein YjbI with pentapeptide repeats
VGDESDQPSGNAWGDAIGDERKAVLRAMQETWAEEAEHAERPSPLAGIVLSGADVYWLAAQTPPPVPPPGVVQGGNVPNRSELHLEGANLRQAHLQGAQLYGAHLEGAVLVGAHLEGATLSLAHLERANLWMARLQGAALLHAHLEGTLLFGAHLDGANLIFAHLERANLSEAHLEGSILGAAHLERACLRGGLFDKTSRLNNAVLTEASFDQVVFDNTNLTVVDWSLVTTLGDELEAVNPQDDVGNLKDPVKRLSEYKSAVRANRLLAMALRAQGIEDADRFVYQAQVLQRDLLRRQRSWGRWAFSCVLAVLSGYGFRLWRILAAYAVVLVTFAMLYWLMGVHSSPHASGLQALWDSFLVSLSAIHGRTMFEQLGAWSPAAWVAAIESVVGIVIEGVFVAMLVQRFFGR